MSETDLVVKSALLFILFVLQFMPKTLEKLVLRAQLAISFRLRENHCVLLEISELAFKIIDLFVASVFECSKVFLEF